MGLASRALALRTETRYSADVWLNEYLVPSLEQFAYGGNTYAVPHGLSQTMTGYRAQEISQSLPGYSAALRGCPPAFAAQMVRALVISQARFTFRNLPSSGTPRRTFGTRALGVLEHPGPSTTTGEMLARMEWHAGLAGNAFVLRRPDRLRVLRPDWVIVVFGSQQEPEDAAFALDGKIIGFVYCNGGFTSGNKPQTLMPEDVAHWCPLPDPEMSQLGMSWITPAVREIQNDRAASEHKLRYWTQGATPNLVVKGIPAMTKDQFDEIVDAMEARHTGVVNAFKTLYLTAGADATVVGNNFKDMDLKNVIAGGETRIAALSRVPPTILGISEGLAGSSLNAGNFAMARRLFADTWVYPTLQDLAGSLADIVDVPRDAELWFDTVDMPLLREDAKDAAEIFNLQVTGITTAVREGFTAESSVASAVAKDPNLLKHTGMTSVQLQEPGSNGGTPSGDGGPKALTPSGVTTPTSSPRSTPTEEDDEERAEFDPSLHPRGAHGQFRTTLDRIVDGLRKWADAGGKGDPFEGFQRRQLLDAAKKRGLTFPPRTPDKKIRDDLLANLRDALAGDESPSPVKKAAKKAVPSAPKLSDDPDIRAVQVENRIREAYRVAAKKVGGPGNWVGIADIRDELGEDLNRHEVDDALRRLEQQDGVNIVPQSNQKALTQADHDSAVSIGGQDKHFITIDDPSPRPLPESKKVTPANKSAKSRVDLLDQKRQADADDAADREDGGYVPPRHPKLNTPYAAGKELDRSHNQDRADDALEGLSLADLREVARDKGVTVSGRTAERVRREIVDGLTPKRRDWPPTWEHDPGAVDRALEDLAKVDWSASEGLPIDPSRGALDHLSLREHKEVARRIGLPTDDLKSRPEWGDAIIHAYMSGRAAPVSAKKAAPSAPDTDPLAPFRDMSAEDASDALDLKKVPELQALLGEAGLKKSGRKRELVDRLVEHLGGGGTERPKADVPEVSDFDARLKKARKGRAAASAVQYRYTGRTTDNAGLFPDRTERTAVSDAFASYRGIGHERINKSLRGGGEPDGRVEVMDRAFAASSLTSDVALWRSVKRAEAVFGDSKDWPDDFSGFEWTDPAFVSTSHSADLAAVHGAGGRELGSSDVLVRILAPEGTPAVGLRAGAHEKPEAEVLLGRGLHFRVVRDHGTTMPDGLPDTGFKRVLDVEVVPAAPGKTDKVPEVPKTPRAPAKKATKAARPPAAPTPVHDLFTTDDATIETALRDVYEGQFGPYTTKATVHVTRAGTRVDKRGREHAVEPSINVEGKVYDADGTEIGHFSRSIAPVEMYYADGTVRREVWAEHQVVQLGGGDYATDPTKYHGTGFGGEFNRRAIEWYRASGVHGISQHDQNGYVWASQGFNFSQGGRVPDYLAENIRTLISDLRVGKATSEATKDEYHTLPKQIRGAPDLDAQIAAAEALLARVESRKPGEPDYPTAYEISQLGRREGQRGRTELWLGKLLFVSADEMILNADEGEVVT